MEAGSILGPYRILEQIGLGGMATVYKAYQSGVDRLVAIKILPDHYARDQRFVNRFKQEARIIARLEHRTIVPIYDFGEQNGLTYIVMRYLQAGTLKDILARSALSLTDAARIISDVAAALDYAHGHHIIHRDVKPSNILVDRQGNAYLTDFGIAKVLEGTHEFTGSALLGTPAYMAPEQTLGKGVTPQSDVYSLGVMLYEMVTGKPPFEADTPMAIALMHVHEPLPLPRKLKADLPEAVELVILKALAKDPHNRFQSAGELAQTFLAVIDTAQVALPGSSERLTELAGLAAAGKGSEEVTYDLRQELRRQQRSESTRKWVGRVPFIGGGFAAIALIGVVGWLGAQFFAAQNSVWVTATAVELSNQTATRVAGYTDTPLPAATHNPAHEQTQAAALTQTQDVNQTSTQAVVSTSARQTQLALTPTAIPTETPRPSPTVVPATYIGLFSGPSAVNKVVRPGKIIFTLWPCWPNEAEAMAAAQLRPVLTVNGVPIEQFEFSGTITRRLNGAEWCPDRDTYFTTTLEAGTYNVQWQWGSQSGTASFPVVGP